MLSCQDVIDQLRDYLQKGRQPENVNQIAAHVAGCVRCYLTIAFLDAIARRRDQREAPHVEVEWLGTLPSNATPDEVRAMSRLLAMAAVAGGLGLAAAAAAAQGAHGLRGTERTITGTVIDGSGTFGEGRAAVAAETKGISMAILGSDGLLYVPVATPVPGDGDNADLNAQLKEFADQEVTVTGTVYPVGGANVIQVSAVRRRF